MSNPSCCEDSLVLHLLGKIRELENECYKKLIQRHEAASVAPELVDHFVGSICIQPPRETPKRSIELSELGEKEQEILKLTHELAVKRNQCEVLEKEKRRQTNLASLQQSKKREVYLRAQKLKDLSIWSSIRSDVLDCFDADDEPELYSQLASQPKASFFLGKRAMDPQLEHPAANQPVKSKTNSLGSFFVQASSVSARNSEQQLWVSNPSNEQQPEQLQTSPDFRACDFNPEVIAFDSFAKPGPAPDSLPAQTKRPGEGIANFISSVSSSMFKPQTPQPSSELDNQPAASAETQETVNCEQPAATELAASNPQPEEKIPEEPEPPKATPLASFFSSLKQAGTRQHLPPTSLFASNYGAFPSSLFHGPPAGGLFSRTEPK